MDTWVTLQIEQSGANRLSRLFHTLNDFGRRMDVTELSAWVQLKISTSADSIKKIKQTVINIELIRK